MQLALPGKTRDLAQEELLREVYFETSRLAKAAKIVRHQSQATL